MRIDWNQYDPASHFDELIAAAGQPRPSARGLTQYLRALSDSDLAARKAAAELAIVEMGITFTVYSEGQNIDRAWPFDIIPRVIPAAEWAHIERGLAQRLTALNHFIDDIYGDQKIIKDKVFPAEVLAKSANFRPQCVGVRPAYGVWAHICGSDLVRDADGTVYVLEDNLRVPSGVSYMLENRVVMKRVFPELFENQAIAPVDAYPTQLFDTLAAISPRPLDYPQVAVLTPGIYNSAYFEHAFLAQRMGAELVEGGDLVVGDDDCVYMRTIEGLSRVDVIYRRVDDLFLDPEVFRADSQLGVPGLMRAWTRGKVALANAPGAGVADDKVVYAYVPDMIRYYLGEDPIIPNVPTYLCHEPKSLEYVLAHLDELVVKPANESGGYGLLIGPHASRKERAEFAARLKADPRNYIAQPTLDLSTVPTLCDRRLEPRHVDLRPFILQADKTHVTAGGLTRVALRKGSLVVNSSQGGGSKDTWIVDGDAAGGGGLMLSRVAERVYWTARYLERAENTARLVGVYANLLLDLPKGYTVGWHTLIGITGSEESFTASYAQADERSVVRFLLTDTANPSSVLAALAGARENVRTTRDLFPAEAWEAVNELHLYAREHATGGVNRSQRHDYLTQITVGCQRLAGLFAGTMSHDAAYDFVRLGRNLERADMTTRILDVGVATLQSQDGADSALLSTLWINVLRSLSAYQMYRRHVRAAVNGVDVAAFLLRDAQFPRAVRYCVDELAGALGRLPRAEAALTAVARISRMLTETDPKAIDRAQLHGFLDDLQRELGHLHGAIASTWFPAPAEAA